MLKSRSRGGASEGGATLVEFAIIFPIFMTLVLGMFSGGQAYDQKLGMTHASREGARYGSSLADDEVFISPATWATTVRDLVIDRSADLASNEICVALVTGTGTGTPASPDFVWKGSDSGAPGNLTEGCYDDGTTDPSQRRVQVLTRRPTTIEALFLSIGVELTARGTAHHEEAT